MKAPKPQDKKMIVDTIRNLGYGKHRPYQVFSDWVEMLALAFSNAVDKAQFDQREARYLEIARRYTKEELGELAGLHHCLVNEFPEGENGIKFGDVLGDVFMACEFGSDCHGQFFTPYHISRMMAQITATSEAKKAIERKGFVQAMEPACGAGGMCVAVAEAMYREGINYQQCLHVTAQDVDSICVHMAYIQMTLLHIPGIVILGDTLRNERRQVWYTMAHVMGGWTAKLRNVEFTRQIGELSDSDPPAETLTPPTQSEREQLHLF